METLSPTTELTQDDLDAIATMTDEDILEAWLNAKTSPVHDINEHHELLRQDILRRMKTFDE